MTKTVKTTNKEKIAKTKAKANSTKIKLNKIKIWKTIKLGTFKSAEGARCALNEAGCHVSRWSDDIFGRIVFSSEEKEVNLVMLTVKELGFAYGATFAQIYEAARKLGLSLCPAEVGPALRAQYRDQPMHEWCYIAMELVNGLNGGPGVFCVVRSSDGLWLSSHYNCLGGFWGADFRLVFVLGK